MFSLLFFSLSPSKFILSFDENERERGKKERRVRERERERLPHPFRRSLVDDAGESLWGNLRPTFVIIFLSSLSPSLHFIFFFLLSRPWNEIKSSLTHSIELFPWKERENTVFKFLFLSFSLLLSLCLNHLNQLEEKKWATFRNYLSIQSISRINFLRILLIFLSSFFLPLFGKKFKRRERGKFFHTSISTIFKWNWLKSWGKRVRERKKKGEVRERKKCN